MGIPGLLQAIKSKSRRCNINEFKGFRVGIDGYSWLHKACFSCAYELSVGIPTAMYLKSFMNRIQLLVSAGIIPVVVFDGADIPLKGNTNSGRNERRTEAHEKAKKYLSSGERLKAIEQYQRSLDITGEIAYSVIQILQNNKIEVQVAPYEADSQLAYLAINNYIHVVITEDSDLLPFRAPRVFYKLDSQSGMGDLFQHQDVLKIKEPPLTADQFLRMCVLSGCDYLPSIKGVGVKKALSWCTLNQNELISAMAIHTKNSMSDMELSNYFEKILQSENAFRYQRILKYDEKCLGYVLQPSTDFLNQTNVDETIGPVWKSDVVSGVLNMTIDPTTMMNYTGQFKNNLSVISAETLKIKKVSQKRQLSLWSFVNVKSTKRSKITNTNRLEVENKKTDKLVTDELPKRIVRSRFFVQFKSKRTLYDDTPTDEKTILARLKLYSDCCSDDDSASSVNIGTILSEQDSEADIESPLRSIPEVTTTVGKVNPFTAFANKSRYNMRRSLVRLAAKKKEVAKTDIKSSDEDKIFALLEGYADGYNWYPKKMPLKREEFLKDCSRMYDRIQEDTMSAANEVEDSFERSQYRALKSLPEVLQAAASRPTTTTWPILFREPTMTPPVASYSPPPVDGLELYEVPHDMVKTIHSGLQEGEDALAVSGNVNDDGSPIDIREEEIIEEERMQNLREAYIWWLDQKQFGPRSETVHRDMMQMKHEQEIKLYTIRRGRRGLNSYLRKRQMIVAPVLRDDTSEGVMYRKK